MTPGTIVCQASLSTEFPRQEYWSGLPFPTPGDLPDPGIEPGFPALQAVSLLTEPPGKPLKGIFSNTFNYDLRRWGRAVKPRSSLCFFHPGISCPLNTQFLLCSIHLRLPFSGKSGCWCSRNSGVWSLLSPPCLVIASLAVKGLLLVTSFVFLLI